MNKWVFFSGALAVALGAFGAHALQPLLDEKLRHTYETAVQYHFYHTLALAFTVLYSKNQCPPFMRKAQYFFFTGLFLFCGSLYTMVLLYVSGFSGWRFLGMITPLGGLSFIVGWLLLFYFFLKPKHTDIG
jgi:uncharacterized membrane protein YgdD (TMEM256/DUF423 family)